jgi:hypothetical protein
VHKIIAPFLAILLAFIGVFAAVAPVAADGTPVDIPLRYVPGISNWGPTSATGDAQVVLVEGEVRVTTSGLTPLSGDLYQAWLVNTKTGDRLSVGKFNAGPDNQGSLDAVVDLSGRVFDLVAITVQPEPDLSGQPDARLSLAGFFPSDGTPTAVAAGSNQPAPLPTPPGGDPPRTVTPSRTVTAIASPHPSPLDLTPLPAVPLKLPSTGGFPPLLGLLGIGLALVGAAVRSPDLKRSGQGRRRAKAPGATDKAWSSENENG